jgi:beta-lactam-binding protein with PASTA domain
VPPHAPPTTSTAPVAGPVDEGRKRWWAWVLLAGAVIAALVAIVWFALAGDDVGGDPSEPTTSEPTRREPSQSRTSEGPETVQVDESDYIGRPVGQVVAELEGLGLNVSRDELDNPGTEDENTVAGVNPSGTLEEGDSVTVSYWGPAPEEPTEPTEPTTPTETTPTETTTTTPSSPTTTGNTGETESETSGPASPSASAISEEDSE